MARYICNKCAYVGDTSEHPNCHYLAADYDAWDKEYKAAEKLRVAAELRKYTPNEASTRSKKSNNPAWFKGDGDIIHHLGDQQIWGWRVQFLDSPFPCLYLKPNQLAVDLNVICYNWLSLMNRMKIMAARILFLESTLGQHLSYGISCHRTSP